uniref:Uncharacterized protein n=1 Tax=Tetranychus urticae TaxID=32264 RepID=T1L3H2_TETUR
MVALIMHIHFHAKRVAGKKYEANYWTQERVQGMTITSLATY